MDPTKKNWRKTAKKVGLLGFGGVFLSYIYRRIIFYFFRLVVSESDVGFWRISATFSVALGTFGQVMCPKPCCISTKNPLFSMT